MASIIVLGLQLTNFYGRFLVMVMQVYIEILANRYLISTSSSNCIRLERSNGCLVIGCDIVVAGKLLMRIRYSFCSCCSPYSSNYDLRCYSFIYYYHSDQPSN